jgi:polar amino acid transport system substrate-binding protein
MRPAHNLEVMPMTRTAFRALVHAAVALAVAAGLAWAAQVAAQAPAPASPTAPGAGFADPAGVAQRQPRRDIEPVYRRPAFDTLATIRKRGVLRVGVAVNEPVVMHDAQGNLVGFSIDAARRLADDMGVQVEFVETSWSGIIPDLLNREFDLVMSGLWVTIPRALVINYSTPTAVEGVYVIASRGAAAGLKSPEDLDRAGTKIVVYAGTLQERLAARRFPKATLVKVDGDSDHLAPVLAGEAQAVLVPTFAPQVIVRAAPDKLALPFAQPLSRASAAFGVRKGDPDFLNFLESWLAVQRDEGWLDERTQFWSDPKNWAR